jgi:hypothetical protein
MTSRRIERERSSVARKLATWAVIALVIIWAARNPTEAVAVLHHIGTGIASLTSHHG